MMESSGVYVNNNALAGNSTRDANPDRLSWSISSGNPIEIKGYTNVSVSIALGETTRLRS